MDIQGLRDDIQKMGTIWGCHRVVIMGMCSWPGGTGNHCFGLFKLFRIVTRLWLWFLPLTQFTSFPLRCPSVLLDCCCSLKVFATSLKVFACLQQSGARQHWLSCKPPLLCHIQPYHLKNVHQTLWMKMVHQEHKTRRETPVGAQVDGWVHPL